MPKKAKVEGELVLRDHNGNSIEFFEEEFILDDEVKTMKEARVIIKKAMLNDRLMRNHKGFKRARTAQVVSFESTKETAEHSEIDKLMLKATQLGCVPENLNNYKRPDFKQKALEKAIALAEKRKKEPVKNNVEDQGYID